MRQRIEVGGNLNGESAARIDSIQEPRKQGRVIGNPLQSRVGKNQVESILRVRNPRRDVFKNPSAMRLVFASNVDHRGGIIESGNLGGRPSGGGYGGAVARSASKIDDPPHALRRDAIQQIVARANPVFAEFQVLVGIPSRHIILRL
jgi:hypothetical protein